jgi:SAM-dependent methyltransferase
LKFRDRPSPRHASGGSSSAHRRVYRTFTHAEARRFYDRLGRKQDTQRFYEQPAVDDLLLHLELDRADAILEFGCGTGRLAEELLRHRLGPQASYLGLDLSGTMVRLTGLRLTRFGSRAAVRQTDGSPQIDLPDASFDRFLSTYVLDLLSPEDIRRVTEEAHRTLRPGALLGLVGLTRGEHGLAKAASSILEGLHRLHPVFVGGCRPLDLRRFLGEEEWQVRYRGVIRRYAISSEILVAVRCP